MSIFSKLKHRNLRDLTPVKSRRIAGVLIVLLSVLMFYVFGFSDISLSSSPLSSLVFGKILIPLFGGIGIYFLPLINLVIGILLLFTSSINFGTKRIFGVFLLLFSAFGLIHFLVPVEEFFTKAVDYGGYVGFFINFLLFSVFGFWGTLIFLLLILGFSFMLLLDVSFRRFLGKHILKIDVQSTPTMKEEMVHTVEWNGEKLPNRVGRIGFLKFLYWLSLTITTGFYAIISMPGPRYVSYGVSLLFDILGFLILIVLLIAGFLLLRMIVKRLHDIGWGFYGTLLLLVMFLTPFGSILILYFIFRSGERKKNKFGEVPSDYLGVRELIGS